MRTDITLRPENHGDYQAIIKLIQRSFSEGTDYSDGTDVLALVEEIRDSEYRIPELSFVAELSGEIVGHFMFSRFPPPPKAGMVARRTRNLRCFPPFRCMPIFCGRASVRPC